MAKPDPQNVFRSAEAFLEVCGLLDVAARHGANVLILVMATLEAFSLELYLKCLILLENGEYRRGHDVFKLFKFLSPQTQAELTKVHDEYISGWPLYLAEARLKGFATDLESLLIRGRHAFEEFRYSHEGMDSKTVWGLKGLVIGIRSRILKARPEWENI